MLLCDETYIVRWLYQTIYFIFFFFANFVQYPAECFNVAPSEFALIFVKCSIRVRLLEIIGIEPVGPSVVLPEQVVH